MATYEQCAAEYDAQLPPERDDSECPVDGCDGLLTRYKVGPDDGWVCNECGWNLSDPEEGYDAILGEG